MCQVLDDWYLILTIILTRGTVSAHMFPGRTHSLIEGGITDLSEVTQQQVEKPGLSLDLLDTKVLTHYVLPPPSSVLHHSDVSYKVSTRTALAAAVWGYPASHAGA